MTQGYGPGHGQQPQWGPGGQEQPPAAPPQWGAPEQSGPAQQPQWGQPSPVQEPQWGQVSPTPAPAGYPGAAGASAMAGAGGAGAPSMIANLVKWLFYSVLALVAVRLIINVVVFAINFAGGAMGSVEMIGVGGLLSMLGLGVNGLVSLVVLVLAIMVIVQGSGRGRTGAIVVVATMVLAVVAYWIVRGTFLVVVHGSTDYSMIGMMSTIYLVIEILRALLVFAALIVGAMMARRWAAQNA
jgi:hypothetical protein